MPDSAFEIFENLKPGDEIYVKVDSLWDYMPYHHPPVGTYPATVMARHEVADTAELTLKTETGWTFYVSLSGGHAQYTNILPPPGN